MIQVWTSSVATGNRQIVRFVGQISFASCRPPQIMFLATTEAHSLTLQSPQRHVRDSFQEAKNLATHTQLRKVCVRRAARLWSRISDPISTCILLQATPIHLTSVQWGTEPKEESPHSRTISFQIARLAVRPAASFISLSSRGSYIDYSNSLS